MGGSPYTVDYSEVTEEEKKYNFRQCPSCPEDHQWHNLEDYKRHPHDQRKTVFCKKCLQKDARLQMEEDHKQVMETLTRAITTATKSRSSRLSHVEIIDLMMEGAGGAAKAARLSGRLLKRAILLGLQKDCARADRAMGLNAASTLLTSSATAEKARPPVDLSDLTQDEWRDILLPCARHLIINDATFRKELLGLTDVRKSLLAEADVELLEVNSNG